MPGTPPSVLGFCQSNRHSNYVIFFYLYKTILHITKLILDILRITNFIVMISLNTIGHKDNIILYCVTLYPIYKRRCLWLHVKGRDIDINFINQTNMIQLINMPIFCDG